MANGIGRRIRYLAAIVFLILGISYAWFYINIAPTANETYWNRFVGLLPIAEALIYASAGFVFGREVHREEAANSNQRANEESRRATDAIANGRALKSSLKGFALQYEPQRMDNLYHLFSVAGSAPQAPLIRTNMGSDLNILILDADRYFPG